MMKLKLFAGLVLLAFALVFTVQNTAVIEVSFLGWTLKVSQALLIFCTFAGGLLTGWLAGELMRLGGKPAT